jgi:hypothetical protein
MAGLYFTVKPAAVITLVASATRTLLQVIAPSNHRVLVHRLEISFNGVTAADPPALLELLIQTTAGTMSALTPVPDDATYDETIQSTAQHTATSEPTASTIKWAGYSHTQNGLIIPGPWVIPGGTRLGLRYTTGTITGTVTTAPLLRCEE